MSHSDENKISNINTEKLLGVPFDRLTFNNHISNLYKTASNKLDALIRVASYMDRNKKRTLV